MTLYSYEIATLPSVARNDITLLKVTAHQQIARDDIFEFNVTSKSVTELLSE